MYISSYGTINKYNSQIFKCERMTLNIESTDTFSKRIEGYET